MAEYWTRISVDIVFRAGSDEDAVEIAKDIQDSLLLEVPRLDDTIVHAEDSLIEKVAEGDRLLVDQGEEVIDEEEEEEEE